MGGGYESGVPDETLTKCATVSEAIAVFRNYNFFTLEEGKFFLAEAPASIDFLRRQGV